MKMTSQEYDAYLVRTASRNKRQPSPNAVALESDLHAEIIAECRRRGWLFFHGRTSKRTHRTPGEPDFVILGQRNHLSGQEPKAYFIECKRKGGKLSVEQNEVIRHAAKLGHTIHVVQSFQEFLEVIV